MQTFYLNPLEPDLVGMQRFQLFQTYSDEYPIRLHTDMFDYQLLLQNMAQYKDTPPAEKLDTVEDIAAALISHLRVALKTERQLRNDSKLIYFTPLSNRKFGFENPLTQFVVEHSQRFRVVGGLPFNLKETIEHGERFMNHSLVVIKYVMDQYPLA